MVDQSRRQALHIAGSIWTTLAICHFNLRRSLIHGYLLNELGCAIIYPNVRGSSGYGKRFLAADDVEKREDAVK